MSIWQALGFSAPTTNVKGQQALAGELYDQRQQFANNLTNYQNRTAPQEGGVSVGSQQWANTAQTAAPQAAEVSQAAFNANPIFAQQASAAPVAHTAVGPTANVQAATAGGAPMFANATQAQAGNAQAGQIDAMGGLRAQQTGAINTLQSAANGEGPSAAQEMLRQQTGANIAQQMAMRASARGGNVGNAERTAADNVANLSAQGAQQASLVRAQEQATSRGQLGQIIEGARGQDIQGQGLNANLSTDVSKFNTGLQAQNSQFNAGAQNTSSLANSAAWNQSLQQQAEREQAARMANAGAYNTAGAQQANISAGEANQAAGLGTNASLANAAAGNNMSQFLRSGFDQNQQFNAGQGNQYNQFLAGLNANVGMANTSQANTVNQFNAGQGNDLQQAAGTATAPRSGRTTSARRSTSRRWTTRRSRRTSTTSSGPRARACRSTRTSTRRCSAPTRRSRGHSAGRSADLGGLAGASGDCMNIDPSTGLDLDDPQTAGHAGCQQRRAPAGPGAGLAHARHGRPPHRPLDWDLRRNGAPRAWPRTAALLRWRRLPRGPGRARRFTPPVIHHGPRRPIAALSAPGAGGSHRSPAEARRSRSPTERPPRARSARLSARMSDRPRRTTRRRWATRRRSSRTPGPSTRSGPAPSRRRPSAKRNCSSSTRRSSRASSTTPTPSTCARRRRLRSPRRPTKRRSPRACSPTTRRVCVASSPGWRCPWGATTPG
jgi:hypothetical protein